MTINIATIGSFITNDSFNSTFNPHAHLFFNVVMPERKGSITNGKLRQSFFKHMKEKQPEYLLLDFSMDVCHGWLPSSKKRNPFKKSVNQAKDWEVYQSFDNYFDIWKDAINQLWQFLNDELPNCRVILVQGHFADTFTDDTSLKAYCEENNVFPLNVEEMNQQWGVLNTYVMNHYDVNLLDVTNRKHLLDRTHMTTVTDFHFDKPFYNYLLNKLLSMTYDVPVMKDGKGQTIQRLYLNDDIGLLHTKQVEVVTKTEQNLINLARKDEKQKGPAYQLYKELLKHDYILYAHEAGVSKLYQRRHVEELWDRDDLHKVGDTFYTLDQPKNSGVADKKLLVIFPCMPFMKVYDNESITDRMFTKVFKKIDKYIADNVYILRIMDLNLSHGSHFINSVNNTTLEKDISDTIIEVKNKLNVSDNDIVLYGPSKGGTGALYYGAKLDLQCLAVDPIIHLGQYNKNDAHFLRDLRKVEISEEINHHLSQGSKFKKYIIGSENVKFNYKYMSKITGSTVIKLNKKDYRVQKHVDVSRYTKFEQLMLLNNMLLSRKGLAAIYQLRGLRKKAGYILGMMNGRKTLKRVK